jgi:hypothetical protein
MIDSIRKERTAWGGTNFQSIIDEIVRIRKNRPNIPLSDYPTTLLVVSDMQFNPCGKNKSTNYERMKEKLYTVFPKDFVDSMKFIWWQVNGSRTTDVPATLDDGGCYFFSGFDGSVITLLLNGEEIITESGKIERKTPTMEEMIDIIMNQEVMKYIKY